MSGPQQVPPPPGRPGPLRPPPPRYAPRPGGPRRSRDDRMIAGVCAGVARALGVDPTWIRLGVVALTVFASGAGLLLYALGWLVVPREPEVAAYVPAPRGDDGGWTPGDGATGDWVPVAAPRGGRAGMVLGAVLIAAGAAVMLSRLGVPTLAGPLFLATVGAAIVYAGVRR